MNSFLDAGYGLLDRAGYTDLAEGLVDGWGDYDWTDPSNLKELIHAENRDMLVTALHGMGIISDEQVERINQVVKTYDATMNQWGEFQADLEKFNNVSKLSVFWEGRARLVERGETVNTNLLLGSVAAVSGVALMGWSLLTSSWPYGIAGAGVTIAGAMGSVNVVKKCLFEGYYSKINELVEKHLQGILGEENVQSLMDKVKNNLSESNVAAIEQLANDAFHSAAEHYLNEKINQVFSAKDS